MSCRSVNLRNGIAWIAGSSENPARHTYVPVVERGQSATLEKGVDVAGRSRKYRIARRLCPHGMAHYVMEALPVTLYHVLASESLPLHHRDPFDRLLIAQASIEGVPIVTADPAFRRYAIKVLW